MAIERYTVRDIYEEGACGSCGYPMYVGDVAFLSECGYMVCTKACGKVVDQLAQETYFPTSEPSDVVGGL